MAQPTPRLSHPPSLEDRVSRLEERMDALRLWQHIVIGFAAGVTFLLATIASLWRATK